MRKSQHLTTLIKSKKIYLPILTFTLIFVIGLVFTNKYLENKVQKEEISKVILHEQNNVSKKYEEYDKTYNKLMRELNKLEIDDYKQVVLQITKDYERAKNVNEKIDIVNKYAVKIKEIQKLEQLSENQKYIIAGLLNKLILESKNVNTEIYESNTNILNIKGLDTDTKDNLLIPYIK